MLGCINIGKQTNNKEEEKFSGRSGKTVVINSHVRRVPNQIGVLHFYSHQNKSQSGWDPSSSRSRRTGNKRENLECYRTYKAYSHSHVAVARPFYLHHSMLRLLDNVFESNLPPLFDYLLTSRSISWGLDRTGQLLPIDMRCPVYYLLHTELRVGRDTHMWGAVLASKSWGGSDAPSFHPLLGRDQHPICRILCSEMGPKGRKEEWLFRAATLKDWLCVGEATIPIGGRGPEERPVQSIARVRFLSLRLDGLGYSIQISEKP